MAFGVCNCRFAIFGPMKFLKIAFWTLWRVWFYILMGLPIIALFPVLLITISKERWYPHFFKIARLWGKLILFGMGFRYRATWSEKPERGKSYMIVANHTSMMDIMLMLAIMPNPFVFVGKQELVKIPIFGFFYKRTCILVDRNSTKSRKAVFDRAQKRLNQGLSICIYPEGGVSEDQSILLDAFKDGAFRLAIDHQIPIIPMSLPDNKAHFPYVFFAGKPGLLRVQIHPFISTQGLSLSGKDDLKQLREHTRGVILQGLIEAQKKTRT